MNPTESYERAVDHLLRYKPEVLDLAGALTTEHPDFAMGHALMAYLCLTATDVPELAGARAAQAAMIDAPSDERTAMHAAAIGAWLAGDWHRASAILDDLLFSWPTDVLALQVGHQLDFFLGDARNLRDRPARSLEAFERGDPRAAAVRGMYAFGLEESGQYEQAEEVGMSAIEVHPDDVWAIHAVVHTLEMRGLVDRGIPFLRSRVDDWGDGNLFTVHNWWHLALFELEAGRHADVLDIYDRHLHNADAAGVPLEMLDASALLWRLKLDDVDSGTPLRRPGGLVGQQNCRRAVVRLQRSARGDGVCRRRPIRRRGRRRRQAGSRRARGNRGVERDDDRRGRTPGHAGGVGVCPGPPRRRRRGARPDQAQPAPVRRLACPARRPAAHPPRVGVAIGSLSVRR